MPLAGRQLGGGGQGLHRIGRDFGAFRELLTGEALDHLLGLGVLLQPGDRVVAALADVVALVAVPGALADHHAGFLRQIQQAAQGADAAAEEDVELGDAEGRRHLVLGHLHLGPDAVFLGAALEGLDAADVEPHRGVELEGVAAGGGLRIAVGDADLLAQLVEEDHRAARLADVAGDLAHGLAHQPGLAAHRQIAHLPLDLGPGREGRHRVDHHDVDGGGTHQLVDDLQGHLAGVRLGDQQVLDVDAQGGGIDRIEGMLGVDEGGHATPLLHLGDGVQGEGGLTGALRPVDLHHPALGVAAAQGQIEGEGTGGDGFHPHAGGIAQPHDRALAEIALDLVEHQAQGLVALGGGPGVGAGDGGGAVGGRRREAVGVVEAAAALESAGMVGWAMERAAAGGGRGGWGRGEGGPGKEEGRNRAPSCDLWRTSATRRGRRINRL